MNASDDKSSCERSPRSAKDQDRLIPRDPKGLETPASEGAPGEISVMEFLQERPPTSSSSTANNYPPRISSIPAGATALQAERSPAVPESGKENGSMAATGGVEKKVQEKGIQKSLRMPKSVSRLFKGPKKDKTGKP